SYAAIGTTEEQSIRVNYYTNSAAVSTADEIPIPKGEILNSAQELADYLNNAIGDFGSLRHKRAVQQQTGQRGGRQQQTSGKRRERRKRGKQQKKKRIKKKKEKLKREKRPV